MNPVHDFIMLSFLPDTGGHHKKRCRVCGRGFYPSACNCYVAKYKETDMKMIGLFSGIGGFELAAHWVWGKSLNIKCMVELDGYCQKVLKKNFTGVPIHDDIRTFKGGEWGAIDLVTGGFPCQPFSVAGKQGGAEDDRYLWPEMFRVIQEARPRWVVGENVTGIINMELDNVLSDLEGEGYETQTFIIPACGTDAKHRRNRIWIIANNEGRVDGEPKPSKVWGQIQQSGIGVEPEVVAHAEGERLERPISARRTRPDGCFAECREDVADTNKCRLQKQGAKFETDRVGQYYEDQEGREWEPEPSVGRVADGVPNRVDRLKGLGNAIVPQVAQRIFWGVRCVDEALAI